MTNLLDRKFAGFRWENAYTKLPSVLFREQQPTPVQTPKLVILNEPLVAELGLDAKALNSQAGVELLAGNRGIEGVTSIAQAYAGHQFGHFAVLGDGRAILIGEHRSGSGKTVDVQWKGPGRTQYSRRGDGRLALGPALREFLISEAMQALRIPTTRSLAVVTTGEFVYREEVLPGAVLTRLASSHVRVGTFQFAAYKKDVSALAALVQYCLERHDSDLGPGEISPERVRVFFERVIDRKAALVAAWLSVGFIHGVMNTDNTSISGETIDFGPCAFLDTYSPDQVFSSIDQQGRYAYGQQPGIAGWNLARLGETLIPLLGETAEAGLAVANASLQTFSDRFATHFATVFGSKLGLAQPKVEDMALVQELFPIAEKEKMDFTQLWLDLTDHGPDAAKLNPALGAWAKSWAARLQQEGTSLSDAKVRMQRSNPVVIPRNHRVEHALERAIQGDLAAFHTLLSAVRTPFLDSRAHRDLGAPPSVPNPAYQTFCGT